MPRSNDKKFDEQTNHFTYKKPNLSLSILILFGIGCTYVTWTCRKGTVTHPEYHMLYIYIYSVFHNECPNFKTSYFCNHEPQMNETCTTWTAVA